MRVCSSYLSTNFVDYPYANLRTKSPDCQFTPKTITIPPAFPKPGTIRPNYLGTPFPTVVFDVAHQNETWSQFIADAGRKAFSINTTIQIWIGIKIYPHHLRAIWGRRKNAGHGMTIGEQVPKFPIHQP